MKSIAVKVLNGWLTVFVSRLKHVPLARLAILIFMHLSSSAALADFFTTSARRELNPDEYGAVVSIFSDAGSCTGFRVKNNQDKIYIATARHCFNYHATTACAESKFHAFTLSMPPVELVCNRIVIESMEDDMMIFEARLKDGDNSDPAKQNLSKFLIEFSLADYYPATDVGLQMIGFPGDKYNNGRAIVSENCNVQPASSLGITGRPENSAPGPRELKPDLGHHNCNVYGGNSGGPVILRNSKDVIAMPATYYPDIYKKGSYYKSALMELTKGFIDRNRPKLNEAGVILSKEPIRKNGTYKYLQLLEKYKTFNSDRSAIQLRILNTNWANGSVEASFSNDSGKTFNSPIKFICEDDKSPNHFCYYQEDNQKKNAAVWRFEIMPGEEIGVSVVSGSGQRISYALQPLPSI